MLPVDILIRSGGAKRFSDFLVWQVMSVCFRLKNSTDNDLLLGLREYPVTVCADFVASIWTARPFTYNTGLPAKQNVSVAMHL